MEQIRPHQRFALVDGSDSKYAYTLDLGRIDGVEFESDDHEFANRAVATRRGSAVPDTSAP